LYAVIPVTIDIDNHQYTGKSTLLQMWGHFILSEVTRMRRQNYSKCPDLYRRSDTGRKTYALL